MALTQDIPIDNRSLAKGLGWFSIALGAAEVLAPGTIKGRTGVPGSAWLLRAYGLREIATGAAILMSDRPATMTWARVAGDLLDIATLAPALRPGNPHREGAMAAMGFVALATATDVLVAMRGDEA